MSCCRWINILYWPPMTMVHLIDVIWIFIAGVLLYTSHVFHTLCIYIVQIEGCVRYIHVSGIFHSAKYICMNNYYS